MTGVYVVALFDKDVLGRIRAAGHDVPAEGGAEVKKFFEAPIEGGEGLVPAVVFLDANGEDAVLGVVVKHFPPAQGMRAAVAHHVEGIESDLQALVVEYERLQSAARVLAARAARDDQPLVADALANARVALTETRATLEQARLRIETPAKAKPAQGKAKKKTRGAQG